MGNKPKGPALTFMTGEDVKGVRLNDAVIKTRADIEIPEAEDKKASKKADK